MQLIQKIGCCLVFAILIGNQRSHSQTSSKPNIIYLYADDLGYGELGVYGQQKIKTPNLDKMAQEGIRFSNHYTSTPVCAPARCMLLTGKHGGHTYIHGNYELGGFADSLEGGQMPLPANTFTIGKLMQQAGYKTAVIGKWGLGMQNTSGEPSKQGFDYYYGYLDQKQAHNYYPTHLWENGKWDSLQNQPINVHLKQDPAKGMSADFAYYQGKDYAPAKMTEKALAFIQQNQKQPFFIYLPYTLPHVSLQAPIEWVNQYVGQFAEQPYFGNQGYASTPYPLSTYAAMISYLDAQVGIILKELKQLGLDKKTLVLFSSDNGATFNGGVDRHFFNSNGGLRGQKMDLYEGGIREPFIARWPGKIPVGTVSDHISAQYDMMATLAEITGQQISETDGISLLPTLLGKKAAQKKHAWLYFEYPENGGQIAIRMGDWKAVKTEQRMHPNNPWQLFDLNKDPAESKDLASQYPQLIITMNEIVEKEHQQAHIQEWEFIHPKFPVKLVKD